LSRNLKQAGLTRKILRKLASERDEVRREEFKAGLHDNFIGDGSEFMKPARMTVLMHDIMDEHRADNMHNLQTSSFEEIVTRCVPP